MMKYEKGTVSVVIPAFQSETYLEQCLFSVVKQSYPSMEVIICDGNSSDKTWEIAGRFAEKYGFVKRIRQTGKGVSNARNEGMEEAVGEYIQFVDSDDFLLPDATARMVHVLESEHADIVLAGYRMLKSGEERKPEAGYYRNDTEFVKKRFAEAYGYRTNFLNTPWNKLFRRKNLTAGFPEDLSMGEDLLFNLEVLRSAAGISVIPDVVYEYNNLNENSLMHQYWKHGIAIETRIHRAVKHFVRDALKKEQGGKSRELKAVLRENYMHALHGRMYAMKEHYLGRE